jgi:hypothetical protein
MAKIGAGLLTTAITAIVLVTVLFYVYAEMIPVAQDAGDSLNGTGVPLGSFFTGSGVVFILIMAALVLVVVGAFLPGKHK